MEHPLRSEATAAPVAPSSWLLGQLAATTDAFLHRVPTPLETAWASFLDRWCWTWFGTYTFHESVHAERADKLWRVYTNQLNVQLTSRKWWKHGAGFPWVRASERQRRGALHFHSLMGGAAVDVPGRWLASEALWEELGGGIARVERIETKGAVAAYVSKYVTKDGEIAVGGELARVEWEAELARLRARLL